MATTEHDLSGLRRQFRQLRQQRDYDQLTGLLNRPGFLQAARRDLNRSRRQLEPVAALVIDIDFFKAVNDRSANGHHDGECCLKLVAQTVSRAADVVGPAGAEEFWVWLAGTDAAGTVRVAKRIQRALVLRKIPHLTSPLSASASLSGSNRLSLIRCSRSRRRESSHSCRGVVVARRSRHLSHEIPGRNHVRMEGENYAIA